MTVSTWLDMLGSLASNDSDEVEHQLERLQSLTSTYSSVDCDVSALGASMDCLLDRAGEDDRTGLALACMREAGLSGGK